MLKKNKKNDLAKIRSMRIDYFRDKGFMLKTGARLYQNHFAGAMLRDFDNQMLVLFAPPNSGKSWLISSFISELKNFTSEKTFVSASLPKSLNNIVVDIAKDINFENYAVIVTSALYPKISHLVNSNIYRIEDIVHSEKLKKEILSFNNILTLTQHDALTDKILPFIEDIADKIADRKKLLIVDEAHREFASTDTNGYVISTENPATSFSPKKRNMLKKLLDLKFVATGYTGTPTISHFGKGADSSFKLQSLTQNDLLEVKANSAYISEVNYLLDNIFGTEGNIVDFINRGISREGITQVFHAKKHRHESIDDIEKTGKLTIQNMKYLLNRGDFNFSSGEAILIWVSGGKEKLYPSGGGVDVKYKDNTDVHNCLEDVKVISCIDSLGTGFSLNTINTILLAFSTLKDEAVQNIMQKITRGVRPSDIGLLIGISNVSEAAKKSSPQYKAIENIKSQKATAFSYEEWIIAKSHTPNIVRVANEQDLIDIVDQIEPYVNFIQNELQATLDFSIRLGYTDNAKLSDNFSTTIEEGIGNISKFIKTGGLTNPEDNWFNRKIPIDVKHSFSKIDDDGTDQIEFLDNMSKNNITLLSGADKLLDSSKLYIIFSTEIIGNIVKIKDIVLCEMHSSLINTSEISSGKSGNINKFKNLPSEFTRTLKIN